MPPSAFEMCIRDRFRTEFVYLNCKDFPTEDYQFEAYKQVVESLAPRKVVVRTCDIGADKTELRETGLCSFRAGSPDLCR